MMIDFECPPLLLASTINAFFLFFFLLFMLSLSLSLSLYIYQDSLTNSLMSTLNQLFDLPEQICYVQCGFCTTILMVSVPCSSMSMVVTVRCGHCTSLLSVNMMKASFVPLHLLASLSTHHHRSKEEDANNNIAMNSSSSMMMMNYSSNDCAEEDVTTINNVVNKPPEKRQRTPSAYNQFIKEEIKRLKAENPEMAHKEAFSTAAKNWANFPPTQFNGDEICNQKEQFADLDSQVDRHSHSHESINEEGEGFHGRKMQRNSIMARTQLE